MSGLIYPLDLPTPCKIRKVSFDLDYMTSTGITRGGKHQVVNLGPELWKCSVRTSILNRIEFGKYRGFISSLRGGLGTIKIWDIASEYPIAYPSGFGGMIKAVGGAFSGECNLVSVSSLDAHEVNLDGLPNEYSFSVGDYIGFSYSVNGVAKRALHRVVIGDSADVLGKATLYVEPPIIPGWSSGLVVELSKVWVVISVDPKSIDFGETEVGSPPVISFSGLQSLGY